MSLQGWETVQDTHLGPPGLGARELSFHPPTPQSFRSASRQLPSTLNLVGSWGPE